MKPMQSIKDWIEAQSGLSLGDALNVLIFLLTVFSLVIAVVGVAIATITYKDAHEGGNLQMEAMRKQKEVLDESAGTLKKQADKLELANQVLVNLLQESKDQLKLGTKQLLAAKSQIKVADLLIEKVALGLTTSTKQLQVASQDYNHRRELEDRHPEIKGQLVCEPGYLEAAKSSMLLFRSAEPDGKLPVMTIIRSSAITKTNDDYRGTDFDGHRTYQCFLSLSNTGQATAEDCYMHISWSHEKVLGREGTATGLISARVPPYGGFEQMSENKDWSVEEKEVWQIFGLTLFSKAKLYTLEAYKRPYVFQFELSVPERDTQFSLDYHIVGSNLPRLDASTEIHQVDPAP